MSSGTSRPTMVQAVGNDGILYRMYRRPYVRRMPLTRQFPTLPALPPTFADEPDADVAPPPPPRAPTPSTIMDLPDACLVKIFEHLPIIQRIGIEIVCKRFNFLAKCRSWNKQDSVTVAPVEDVGEDGRYRFDAKVLYRQLLSRCGPFIKELTVFVVAPCDRFFKLIQFLPNLRYLCLESLDPLSGSEFKAIGERCPKLRVLLVRHCYLHYTYKDGFVSMMQNFKQLRAFICIDCDNFDKYDFASIPESLRMLEIRYSYPQPGHKEMFTLTTNIRKRIPQLASLMIHDDKLEERSLNQIFLLANLRTFAFSTPIKDSQPLLIENLRNEHIQRMESLSCGPVPFQLGAAKFSVDLCQQIEHLRFTADDSKEWQAVLNRLAKFPKLRSLYLHLRPGQPRDRWGGGNIPPESWSVDSNNYSSAMRALAGKGQLEYLYISAPLSTEVVIRFLQKCPKLKALYFLTRKLELPKGGGGARAGQKLVPMLDSKFEWAKVHTVLTEEVHPGKPEPNSPKQKLKMFSGIRYYAMEYREDVWNFTTDQIDMDSAQLLPTHPWVEFQDNPERSHVEIEINCRNLGCAPPKTLFTTRHKPNFSAAHRRTPATTRWN